MKEPKWYTNHQSKKKKKSTGEMGVNITKKSMVFLLCRPEQKVGDSIIIFDSSIADG